MTKPITATLTKSPVTNNQTYSPSNEATEAPTLTGYYTVCFYLEINIMIHIIRDKQLTTIIDTSNITWKDQGWGTEKVKL